MKIVYPNTMKQTTKTVNESPVDKTPKRSVKRVMIMIFVSYMLGFIFNPSCIKNWAYEVYPQTEQGAYMAKTISWPSEKIENLYAGIGWTTPYTKIREWGDYIKKITLN